MSGSLKELEGGRVEGEKRTEMNDGEEKKSGKPPRSRIVQLLKRSEGVMK